MSIYIRKVKITAEHTPAGHYRFGCTYLPSYKQFEFNFGRYVLNFWYRP